MLTPIQARCLTGQPGIAHGFFTRQGGVSTGLYASLNCGPGSEDEAASVIENRTRVASHLGVAVTRLVTPQQIHGVHAVVATAAWTMETMPKADAIVTQTRGLAIGVLAADCTPVLFADPEAGVIGAAHAGWRGAVGGVIEATVAAMVTLGARRDRIRAAIGPCISPDAYEVGPEFEARVLALDPANQRFLTRHEAQARAHFDLPACVLERLRAEHLGDIENASVCTYGRESLLFSYRRTTHRRAPDYGRQISAIVLT